MSLGFSSIAVTAAGPFISASCDWTGVAATTGLN